MSAARKTASLTDRSAHSSMSRSSSLPTTFGKCTSKVGTLLPESVHEDLADRARMVGMSEGELLREWVMLHLYGESVVRSMQEKRFAIMAGIGPVTSTT